MTAQRTATIARETSESSIQLSLDLDGTGASSIDTGVPFFDHMLTALSKHSLLDLTVKAVGDTHIDVHHTVEDIGIVLGKAIGQALGDKSGIARFGDALVPLDEALVQEMVKEGVKTLTEQQCSDGGWGWFSGWGVRAKSRWMRSPGRPSTPPMSTER